MKKRKLRNFFTWWWVWKLQSDSYQIHLTIQRTDVQVETSILWPPNAKTWLIRKDPDSGKEMVGRDGDDRGWDICMASPTWWTWVWVSSRSWWWTGKPDVLQSIRSLSQTWQSDWTELIYARSQSEVRLTSELISAHRWMNVKFAAISFSFQI